MYTTVFTVVEGALDQELDIPDDADAQAILDRFVLDVELAAKSDGLETLVYVLPHYHAIDAQECECGSFIVTYAPAYKFN